MIDGVVTDVVTVTGIAALVWIIIQATGGVLPAKAKPAAAVGLGVAWALAAFVSVPGAYDTVLAAVATGATAGAAASGIESYRKTFTPS